ncbi:hypothetical protein [Microbacterium aurantiacum]|uniref:hypothetical protein n=1 Tax=Microbacterium aurantiacum TaxID=162393 RepID=UPI00403730DE
MSHAPKRFIFRPLWVFLGAVATGVTILLGVLQIGGWITDNATWILWVAVAVLIVVILLLIARVSAVTEEKDGVVAELEAARADIVEAAEDAASRISQLEASQHRPIRLGEVDGGLARQLYEYSSDLETLDTLANFFPYQIPLGPVRNMERLAHLPQTRTAHNELLGHQLTALAEAARRWLTELQQIVSTDGDHYTTRLDRHVSEEAYRNHRAMTDHLGSVGFELHDKLLEYQRFYASLEP